MIHIVAYLCNFFSDVWWRLIRLEVSIARFWLFFVTRLGDCDEK